jgi:hypothetical protein
MPCVSKHYINQLHVQSSSEGNNPPDSKEIPRLLWKSKIHYYVQKIPTIGPVLRHMNPLNILTTSLRTILILSYNLNTALTSFSVCLVFLNKMPCVSKHYINQLHVQSSSEGNNPPDSKEIPRLLWKSKIHYCIHKIPTIGPVLRHMNPLNILTTSLRTILILSYHLNPALTSDLLSSGFRTKFLNAFLLTLCVLHVLLYHSP